MSGQSPNELSPYFWRQVWSDFKKLYRQILHQNHHMGYLWEKLIETITTSIFYSNFKVNNENDMAAHSICFYFSFCQQQPSKIGQNSCRASADTPLAGLFHQLQIYFFKNQILNGIWIIYVRQQAGSRVVRGERREQVLVPILSVSFCKM